MAVTISLHTRTGDRIHVADIPAPVTGQPPQVIVWGPRAFVLLDDCTHVADGEGLDYIETRILELPSLHEAPAWGRALGRAE